MAFCGKCGTQVSDGIKFCPSCGAGIGAAGAQQAQGAGTENVSGADDAEKNKAMGVLAYLSWLVLIPLFAAKDSKFARFHANQGLVLAITEIAWWILTIIINAILLGVLSYRSWGLYTVISTILGLVNIVFLVFAIIGIMNAVKGKEKPLPVIGKFKILK